MFVMTSSCACCRREATARVGPHSEQGEAFGNTGLQDIVSPGLHLVPPLKETLAKIELTEVLYCILS